MLTNMLKEMLKERLEKIKPTKMDGQLESPDKAYFPTLYLNSKDLPEIKDWSVGEEYYIVLKVEQKSKSMRTEGEEEKWNADFDIKEIGVIDEESDDTEMEDDMEGEDDDKISLNNLKKKYGG